MGLSGFERRLERIVDGTMGRLVRSGIQPVELGHKLTREVDARRTLGVDGRTLVPNAFTIRLCPDDCEALEQIANAVCRDLAGTASHHAATEGFFFIGPPQVVIMSDPSVRRGVAEIESRFDEGPLPEAPNTASTPAAAGAPPTPGEPELVLPDGQRVPLGVWLVTIGRDPDSTIILQDPNASRQHAEIRPVGDKLAAGFDIVDLQSTNGVQVNGTNIERHRLRDGDVLTFGTTSLRFVASAAP